MKKAVQIELATPADAYAIARLSARVIEHGLPWRWTPPRIQRAIRDARTNVVVARLDGVVAGFGVMIYGDEVAHLVLFAVAEAQRRRRIGSRLLEWLELVARTAGIARVRLEARSDNAAARAFYRRQGYIELRAVPGMYLGMEDGVHLEKTLFEALRLPYRVGSGGGA
jgi:ribosomal-protein-alanine N-acetyltransferase